MIDNIGILLVVNYLDRVYDERLSIDEREHLRIQFERALSSADQGGVFNGSFERSSLFQHYLLLDISQIDQISIMAHRWFWEQIGAEPIPYTQYDTQIIKKYSILTDPLIRYEIIKTLLENNQRNIVVSIFNQFVSDEAFTNRSQIEEFVDILLDLHLDTMSDSTPNQSLSLQIIRDLIPAESESLRQIFRNLLRFRLEFLTDNLGDEIKKILDLDETSDQ